MKDEVKHEVKLEAVKQEKLGEGAVVPFHAGSTVKKHGKDTSNDNETHLRQSEKVHKLTT